MTALCKRVPRYSSHGVMWSDRVGLHHLTAHSQCAASAASASTTFWYPRWDSNPQTPRSERGDFAYLSTRAHLEKVTGLQPVRRWVKTSLREALCIHLRSGDRGEARTR